MRLFCRKGAFLEKNTSGSNLNRLMDWDTARIFLESRALRAVFRSAAEAARSVH